MNTPIMVHFVQSEMFEKTSAVVLNTTPATNNVSTSSEGGTGPMKDKIPHAITMIQAIHTKAIKNHLSLVFSDGFDENMNHETKNETATHIQSIFFKSTTDFRMVRSTSGASCAQLVCIAQNSTLRVCRCHKCVFFRLWDAHNSCYDK